MCPNAEIEESISETLGLKMMLVFNDMSALVGHFVVSQRKGEMRQTRYVVEEMKERDRKERGTEMKGRNRRNKNSTLTCYKDSRPCPTVSQYQLDAPVM